MFGRQVIYLLLVAFTLIIHTQQDANADILADFKKYQAECVKEVGLELAYVQKNWNDNRFPNDDKMKCYFKCVFLKLGSMNEKGEVVDDVLRKVSAPFNDANTDREIVAECGAIEGTDLCDTAYKLAACVRSAQLD